MDNKLSSCFGWVVGYLILTVVGVAMDGWALSKIWNWFIPPIFALPTLQIMQAVGVSLTFQLFIRTNKLKRESSDTKFDSDTEKLVYNVLEIVFVPLFSVGVAWIVLQFAF